MTMPPKTVILGSGQFDITPSRKGQIKRRKNDLYHSTFSLRLCESQRILSFIFI